MRKLIAESNDIFWLGDKIESYNTEKHEINLTDEKPVYVKQFPLPHRLKESAVKETEKLIANGLVKPSKSAFNAPTWVVKKKETAEGKRKRKRINRDK